MTAYIFATFLFKQNKVLHASKRVLITFLPLAGSCFKSTTSAMAIFSTAPSRRSRSCTCCNFGDRFSCGAKTSDPFQERYENKRLEPAKRELRTSLPDLLVPAARIIQPDEETDNGWPRQYTKERLRLFITLCIKQKAFHSSQNTNHQACSVKQVQQGLEIRQLKGDHNVMKTALEEQCLKLDAALKDMASLKRKESEIIAFKSQITS